MRRGAGKVSKGQIYIELGESKNAYEDSRLKPGFKQDGASSVVLG